jgi:Tfp pilus assembly protein FimT
MKSPKTFTASRAAGFTLIEILINTAIVTMLLGMGLFISFDSYRRYLLNSERDIAVGVLQKARSRAFNNIYQTPHGVHIDSNAFTLFRGTSYIAGSSTNETFPANAAVTQSGITDIWFDQLSADASVSGTLVLANGVQSKTISINDEGTINW